ncbi:hypothetical protein XENOCAPTIV_027775 [Xenoophorus captivus]|uniref:Uncharacterized protein n=1 Tax=Xenoophorus captivus TaxID=1517983 RepID=A0ABV0RL03_9TELE
MVRRITSSITTALGEPDPGLTTTETQAIKDLMVPEKKAPIQRLPKELNRAGQGADLKCTINRGKTGTGSDDADRSSLQKHRLMRRWTQREGLVAKMALNMADHLRILPAKLEKSQGLRNLFREEEGEG